MHIYAVNLNQRLVATGIGRNYALHSIFHNYFTFADFTIHTILFTFLRTPGIQRRNLISDFPRVMLYIRPISFRERLTVQSNGHVMHHLTFLLHLINSSFVYTEMLLKVFLQIPRHFCLGIALAIHRTLRPLLFWPPQYFDFLRL